MGLLLYTTTSTTTTTTTKHDFVFVARRTLAVRLTLAELCRGHTPGRSGGAPGAPPAHRGGLEVRGAHLYLVNTPSAADHPHAVLDQRPRNSRSDPHRGSGHQSHSAFPAVHLYGSFCFTFPMVQKRSKQTHRRSIRFTRIVTIEVKQCERLWAGCW